MSASAPPYRQVRAAFSDDAVRVYQAYSPEIATAAVAAQTFVAPFKRERMTWIKPSFTWMMYRAGWGTKPGQERILAIEISRQGWEWALANACLSHFDSSMYSSMEEWKSMLGKSPVRIQWDPERSLRLGELSWRAIQVGLEGKSVDAYVDQWIVKIEDVTALARQIAERVAQRDLEEAEALRPVERAYPLPREIGDRIGCTVITEA